MLIDADAETSAQPSKCASDDRRRATVPHLYPPSASASHSNVMLESQQERNQLLADKSKLLQEIAEIRTRKGSGSSETETEGPDSALAELQPRDINDNKLGLDSLPADVLRHYHQDPDC